MSNKVEIDLSLITQQVKQGMTIKQLQDYWGCSRTKITSFKKENNLVGLSPNAKKRDNGNGTKTCLSCKTTKSVTEFYSNGYDVKGNKKLKPSCKNCENNKLKESRYTLINELLYKQDREYKCELCGYDNNLSALCFHHYTEEKNFQISNIRNLNILDIDELDYELFICKVLCHNCHMEVHNPTNFKSMIFGPE